MANRGWWVSNEGCGGQKSDGCGGLNKVSNGGWWWPKKSPSVSHFERGRGGVCREEDVGGQQNPSVSHSSAGGVVCIERWWWCQTDGGGGQKSPSVLHLNEEGVVVGKRAPLSHVRATIPPPPSRWFGCAGHIGSGGGVGGKGLTLSQQKGRPSPSRCSSSCFEQGRGLWWPRFSSISCFE